VVLTPLPDRQTGFDGMADVGDAVVPVIDLRRSMAEGGAASGAASAALPVGDDRRQRRRVDRRPGAADRNDTEDHLMPAEDAPNLPVSEVLHLNGQMMSVVSLDRLLPQL